MRAPSVLDRRGPVAMAALACVILAVALTWLHPQIALHQKIYASSDAEAAAAFQSLGDGTDGEFPHWNPFVFAGMPSYASLAHNPGVYPLTGPIRLLRDTFGLPPMLWMLVHLGLAGLFTVGWVRWRGHPWAVAIAAGCWVAALPKLAAWGAYGHGTKLGSYTWLPLVGWCAEGALRRGGIGWVAGLALALGMMLLRGHVQIAYYAVMLVTVLVIAVLAADLRDPQRRAPALRRTAWLAVAGVVALGLSLSLYLPVLEYQAHSVRGAAGTGGGAAWEYATNWSLSWPELATMWWPTAAGYGRGAYVGQMPFTDYPNYVGLPLLLLALAGAVVRRDRFSWALVGLVGLTTMLALGDNFFLYRVFYEVLPGFRKFRVPSMILSVQQLALILLAARGLDAVFVRRDLRVPRPVLLFVGLIGVLGLIVGTVGSVWLRDAVVDHLGTLARQFQRPVPPPVLLGEAADLAIGDALRIGAILLATSLILFAAGRERIGARAAVALVALLVFVDLWRVDQPLLHPESHLSRMVRGESGLVVAPSESLLGEPEALQDYTEESELARWLKTQSPRPRVLPLGGLESDNRLAAQGIVSLSGYHAAKLKVYEDVRARMYDPAAPRFDLARMFAARWVVTPAPLSGPTLEAIGRFGLPVRPDPAWSGPGGVAYAVVDPIPRARVVGSVAVERSGADTTSSEPAPEVLERVLAPGFDPARTALLSAAPDPVPQAAAASARVEIVEERYNEWTAEVDLPAPGVLVTADPWYPEWEVWVDGKRTRLLRANYAQRAVALPAGRHTVEFRYAARSYATGRRLAAVSWVLVLGGLVWAPVARWRRKQQMEREQA